jgi:NAD(P)H-hydrate epimerase
MTLGYTAQQVRDAEAPHLAAGEPLMQRAAHGLAEEVRQLAQPLGQAVLLLVGSGDNGGDALFAGAELSEAGLRVVAAGVGSRMHEAGSAAARSAGVEFARPDPEFLAALPRVLSAPTVVVDGILGTGTRSGAPALRGAAREVVEALLALIEARASTSGLEPRPTVVAVDLPSGIDPDTGAVADDVVLPATLTVTFGGVKAGLLRGRGAELAGDVRLVPIGIEADLARFEPAIRTR